MRIYFSEPIDAASLTDTSVQLIDKSLPEQKPVPAYLYTGVDNGQLYVTVQPQGNLKYANKYQLRVTTGLTDLAESNAPDVDGNRSALPLFEERSITFETKVPTLYSPTDANSFDEGREVALYRSIAGRSYAFVAAGSGGIKLLDVTNPSAPILLDTLSQTNAGVDWEIRGVAVDNDSRLLCVTENIRWASGEHYGYLRVYNAENLVRATLDGQLTAAVKAQYRQPVGKAQLAAAYSGAPGRLVVYRGHAYVTNTGVGVQVVDLQKAQTGGAGDTAIVGVFATNTQGYGIPISVVLGKGPQLFVTTGSGKLVLLDIKTPAAPMILSEFSYGSGINNLDYAPDYKYVDEQQQIAYVDLVLIATRSGELFTVDYTDIYSPKSMAQVLDDNDQSVYAFARDLAISSETGTAVVNTFNSFVIIDLRDPFKPRLLKTLTLDKNEVLGSLNGMLLVNGWVYVANDRFGLRTLNLDRAVITVEPRYLVVDGDGSLYQRAGVANAGKLTYTIDPNGYQPDKVELIIYKQPVGLEPVEVARRSDISVADAINLIEIPQQLMSAESANGGAGSTDLYYGEVVIGAGGLDAIHSAKIPIIRQAVLIPDFDRNRKINNDDRKVALAGKTFYFWINDDDDMGETSGSDIPGDVEAFNDHSINEIVDDELDFENDYVDGVRDLVDFFPVQLDLNGLLELYPANNYSYRLTTGGEHLSFVYTKFTGGQAGYYLIGEPGTGAANDLTEATILGHVSTQTLGTDGIGLFNTVGGDKFLSRVKAGGQDVILIEGRKLLDGPLALEIGDGLNSPLRFELNLSLAPVEQMFRHVNLIDKATDNYNPPQSGTKWGEPSRVFVQEFEDQFGKGARETFESFDSTLDQGNFVFVHGYNVNGQQARGWQSEMFKRLFWSGSKTKFWGVSWYGADGQIGPATPDFHINVQHALRTAPELKEYLSEIIVGPKDIAAHSLGNMLINSALLEYGTVPDVRNVFMIDSAVTLEAYTGELSNGGDPDSAGPDDAYDPVTSPSAVYSAANPMILPDWYGYAKKLGSAEWYKHFKQDTSIGGGEDQRYKLSFRDRFSNLAGATYYNFYSKGEEVLGVHTGDINLTEDLKGMLLDGGRNAWALQEKAKGFLLGINYGGSDYGGWAFASPYVVTTATGTISYSNNTTPLATANLSTSAELKVQPFFKLGQASPLAEPGGSGWAEAHRSQLLAEAIPATTVAMGGRGGKTVDPEIIDETRNLDMQDTFTNGWPQERGIDKRWRHSDLRNVSYLYIYNIFGKLANPTGARQ